MARRKHRKTNKIIQTGSLDPTKNFHITVGAALQWQGNLDLAHEIRLLKAALLYADRVKLCSLTSSVLVTMAQYENMNAEEKREVVTTILKEYIKTTDDVPAGTVDFLDMLSAIQQNRRLKKELKRTLPHQQFLMLHKFDKFYRELMTNMKGAMSKGIAKITDGVRVDELDAALRSGLIEFYWVNPGGSSDEVIKEFYNVVSEAVTSDTTYPLFDDMTGGLVSAAIQEGKLNVSDSSINRAQQVGLSADLLSRLPLFDNASVDEVLDIRKELETPLIRFRAAITDYSTEIKNASWDEGFPLDAEKVFQAKVQPAVLEIEEAYKSNKRLMSYINKLIDAKSLSGLGILLASTNFLPDTVAKFMAGTAAVTTVLYQAEKEWREKNEEIEKNQLYFYYRTRERLKSS